MIYLACPYSHPNPLTVRWRYLAVNRVAGYLMDQGKIVFSPISHSHPIDELLSGPPRDWEYWRRQDFEFLSLCEAMYVLCLDGWRESTGVRDELVEAQRLSLPVVHLFQSDLPIGVLG